MQMLQAAVAFFAVLWYNTQKYNDFCVPARPGRLGTKGGAGMRRMKWLVWLLAVLVCVTVLSGSVLAAGDEVTFMTIHVDAASDGSCRVTATAEVDCGTSPTRIVFPLHSGASNISATGGDYKKQTIDGVKCVVFRSDAGFAGKQTFTCTYDLPCSASEQSDGELFTLALLEKGWDYPIRAIEISLTFPSEITVQPTWNSSYYGDVIDNFLRISIRENTITATATTFLKDHETLSFRMLCPSGFFDLHHQPGKTVAFDRIAFYVLLAAALVYWFLRLRGKPILPKKQQTFSPEATAGELVCQLYSQRPDAAAMLASWGALGYVTIYRNPRGRIILKKQMDMGTERKPAERKLFQAIFAHDPICDAQSIRFRSAYKASAGMLRNGWTQRMFRKKTGSPYLLRALAAAAGFVLGFMIFDVRLPAVGVRWLLLPLLSALYAGLCLLVQNAGGSLLRRRRLPRQLFGLGAAALLLFFASGASLTAPALLCILLQLFCGLMTTFGGQRTPIGRETVSQLLGLRTYLRRMDRDTMERLSRSDGQTFYRLLPFAEILGVGASFSKRFADWQPEPCAWLTDALSHPRTAKEFYQLYSELASAVRAEPYGRFTGLSGQTPQRRRRRRAPMKDYYEEEV